MGEATRGGCRGCGGKSSATSPATPLETCPVTSSTPANDPTPGVTNAGTEATNRTVKTAARTAYGFRHLDNQCRRVRFACTRQHRRVTAS
jgi:hypothetical protein